MRKKATGYFCIRKSGWPSGGDHGQNPERLFGVVSQEHRSKAIEGEKAVGAPFSVTEAIAAGAAEADGPSCVTVATKSVTAKIFDDFKVDFYAADGRVLCRDYREARCGAAGLSDEMKALKAAEGHQVEEKDAAEGIQVIKRMEGDESFMVWGTRPAFWTNGAMNT